MLMEMETYKKASCHSATCEMPAAKGTVPPLLSSLAWIPLALTIVLGAARLGAFQVGSWTDDAWYIAAASALAKGLGYVRPWTPGLMPETNLPVGYPLLLAPLRVIFPSTFIPMQLLSLAAAVGTIGLCYVYYRRRLEEHLAWLVTLLVAVHVAFVGFSTVVMTEAVYTLLSMGLLVVVDCQERAHHQGIGRYLLMGLVATGACFVRGWGITVVGASVVYLLVKHRWRGAAGVLLPFVALYGPWSVRNVALGATSPSAQY